MVNVRCGGKQCEVSLKKQQQKKQKTFTSVIIVTIISKIVTKKTHNETKTKKNVKIISKTVELNK